MTITTRAIAVFAVTFYALVTGADRYQAIMNADFYYYRYLATRAGQLAGINAVAPRSQELGPILSVGSLARQKENYQDCWNAMRAWPNRTAPPSDRRFDNATSNRSEVMWEHDKRIIEQATGLMHGRGESESSLGSPCEYHEGPVFSRGAQAIAGTSSR
ncbi:MAG: hypothetical protein ABSG65_14640 [Bryobacteraceae bacterium]